MSIDNWTKFSHLSKAERWLLVQAALLLPFIHIGLFFLRYIRFYHLMERSIPLKHNKIQYSESEIIQQGRQVTQLVATAARYVFFDANCLRKSLLIWLFLRRYGIQSNICTGVCIKDKQLVGHAWVEYNGIVINDTANVRTRFPLPAMVTLKTK